jgi:two-component system, OmpR family, response regulator RegX3
MKSRIVVADDDVVGAKVIQFVLTDEGYDVISVARGNQVIEHVVGRETDLVILDVNLPDVDGFDVCTELRARRYSGPLIFLTCRSSTADKLEGFKRGADDYLIKPFDPLELIARIQSVIRRSKRVDEHVLFGTVVRVGDAELSVGELTYTSKDVPSKVLTPTEMRLLEFLMRNTRIVISRERLIERVWGVDFVGDSNRVDVYIHRVRCKIEVDPTRPQYLQTVRGLGYVFHTELESGSTSDAAGTLNRLSPSDSIVPMAAS